VYEVDSSIILNRMQGNVPSDIDTTEGSFSYDNLSPVSQEIGQSNVQLNEVLLKVFATSAAANGYSTELEQRCEESGVIKKNGTKSTGQATFSGTETTPIPIGTVIQTTGGLQYITTTAGVITNGTATVNIEAMEISSIYNVPSDIIVQIPTSISGITGVSNSIVTSGGTDIETDSSLLNRYLVQVQSPATSGNSAHYKQWALSVDGIGEAIVFPLWDGPGTVKVTAVDSNTQPLSNDLLTALTTYIESVRPIGATITYESAIALPIDISVNVTRDTAYTQADIIAALTISIISYLKGIYSKQNYVSYGFIGSLIMSCQGVIDYSSFTLNNGTVNIAIGEEQVAIQGTVEVDAP